jgi:hypothetical protein
MTTMRLIVAGIFVIALTGNALAAERGRGHDRGHDDRGSRGSSAVSINVQIGDMNRAVIQDYYRSSMGGGRCPPGLAKKHNGCMPPGQAKKWKKGYRLPRDVVFYDLPPDLAVRVDVPAGYRLVRAASDILMIAVGTGMVIDAIEDLNRL